MRKIGLMLALLIFASVQVIYAQTITGKVTSSEDGGAIPGATVIVKGTMIGVTTDLTEITP
ncbi:MAG: carboxypeptidase-like regulatory domain-containing protein [Lentimicrobium sp.]|nr:carboxypeptidase-like regulatory domain-containing protein [Lentimicrobium sp.]